jgi:hypothetical protein
LLSNKSKTFFIHALRVWYGTLIVDDTSRPALNVLTKDSRRNLGLNSNNGANVISPSKTLCGAPSERFTRYAIVVHSSLPSFLRLGNLRERHRFADSELGACTALIGLLPLGGFRSLCALLFVQ